MAEKKVSLVSGDPKTPRLIIDRLPNGSYEITYAKQDPLNLRSEFKADLNREIQRLFGYQDWSEYKQDNQQDLTKSVERNEDGKVTQAPTVHPFHVAYGIEEFFERFDPNEYEALGIPYELDEEPIVKPDETAASSDETETTIPTKEEPTQAVPSATRDLFSGRPGTGLTQGLDDYRRRQDRESLNESTQGVQVKDRKKAELGKAVVTMRKNYFGDPNASAGGVNQGVLNMAILQPQEGLINTSIINRIKKRYNFKELFIEKFSEDIPVRHPNGKFWMDGATYFDQTTTDVEQAMKVSIEDILSTSNMLKEQLLREFAPAVAIPPNVGYVEPLLRLVPQVSRPVIITGAQALEAVLAQTGTSAANSNVIRQTFVEVVRQGGPAAARTFPVWIKPVLIVMATIGVGYGLGKLVEWYFDDAPTPLEELREEGVTLFPDKQSYEAWRRAEVQRGKQNRFRKLESKEERDWWLKTDFGKMWLKHPHGREWLQTETGKAWRQQAEPVPEPEPEPVPPEEEPLPERDPDEKKDPEKEKEPRPAPEVEPTPGPDPLPERDPDEKKDPEKEKEPRPIPAPVPLPPTPSPSPEPEPDPEVEPQPGPIPSPEPSPSPVPEPSPSPVPEPAPSPAPEPGPSPGPETEDEGSPSPVPPTPIPGSDTGPAPGPGPSPGGDLGPSPTGGPSGGPPSGTPDPPIPFPPDMPLDIKFHLVPKRWREAEGNKKWLTDTEYVLTQRTGAATNFSLPKIDTDEAEAPDQQKPSAEGSNVLLFGHSQIQDSRWGEALESRLRSAGAKVTRIHKGGHDDNKLVKKLKAIKQDNYTHAYLFLNGNTGTKVTKSNLQKQAKIEIINYMINNLKIPKDNILVVLPPVNLDNKYSRNRTELHMEATKIFEGLGVKVAPLAKGTKENFSDNVHIKGDSDLGRRTVEEMFNSSFAQKQTDVEDVPENIPLESLTKQQVARIVVQETRLAGVDPEGSLAIAYAESGMNHLLTNSRSGAAGLFQYMPGFKEVWEKAGMKWKDRFDPRIQTRTYSKIIKGKINRLKADGLIKSSSPSSIDADELYLVYLSWQQGDGGIRQVFQAIRTGNPVSSAQAARMRANFPSEASGDPTDPKNFLRAWKSRMSNAQASSQKYYSQALDNQEPQKPPGETLSIAGIAAANNKKYFGNTAGTATGDGWKSTAISRRPTSVKAARVLGHIPYKGSTKGRNNATIRSDWLADNIISVQAPISYSTSGPKNKPGPIRINKHVAPYLLAAIAESRAKYGLPMSHIGAFSIKGLASGFSAHAWGAAIDLEDAIITPFTIDGLLDKAKIKTVLAGGNYKRYWNLKNSKGENYKDYLEERLKKDQKAISIYEFVGGPLNNNGIAKIFKKHGFGWGGSWSQRKKDIMHFEFLPDLNFISENNKNLSTLLNVIDEVLKDELDKEKI